MIKLPQSIIIAMIAFNFTAFAILLQLDWLTFGNITEKIIAWTLSIGSWLLAWRRRKKYFTLF